MPGGLFSTIVLFAVGRLPLFYIPLYIIRFKQILKGGNVSIFLSYLDMSAEKLRTIIDRSYLGCGFDAAAVLPFSLQERASEHLREWVRDGMHGGVDGGLGYIERSAEYRGDLRRLMPTVRSVVVTLSSYKRDESQPDGVPRIARFAWGDDYHDVLKGRLRQLLDGVRGAFGPYVRGRAVVDSAPTFEREWAVEAGLGWVGRSSMLVNSRLGSYTLIGLLLLDLPVESNEDSIVRPLFDGCGGCKCCVEACPTGAITGSGVIDARRCLSFQTIEAREGVDPAFADRLDGRIFGCDACLEACPYNATAPVCTNMSVRREIITTTAAEWEGMSESDFTTRFAGSALLRAGISRIQKLL